MKKYIKLLRVKHYIKNLLVFAALVFSGQMQETGNLMTAFRAFCAFCLVSSTVYIINDVMDVEKDRLHPKKCQRPIASGQVPILTAVGIAVVLAAGAVALSCGSWTGVALILGYLGINIGYSMGLKNIPIVDICILTAGFVLRVLYGAVMTGISVSDWMYLTVLSVSMYLSFGKRRNELRNLGSADTRKVLAAYPLSFLNQAMLMCLTLSNVFYALWSIEGEGRIFTVPIVLVTTLKYNLTVEGNSDGDPVEVLLHDRMLVMLCAAYAAVILLELYL